MIQTPGETVLKQMLLANSAASAGSAVAARPIGSPPVTPARGIFFNEKSEPMYRVGKSDTLTTIAVDHLGRWARWRQVYEMNRDQLNNPNKLQIGMVLKLPADASRTAMSRSGRGIR
ncbi:MAG: LysM peptidoglycan-binding domain-containing protein [Fuerstiella sp.]|nr:LysM peptidoglycan-binding domain-containing protein [Fuerstiella sp.]